MADDRLHPLFALALDSGMRRGEIAGLRWAYLDAARVTVRTNRVLVDGSPVEGTPKSGAGRSVDLAGTVTVLRRWRTLQLQERMAWGPAWADTGYVFTREDGEPLHPEAITSRFDTLLRHLPQLPSIRLHDLRHTSATIALAAGVHPKVVQERLGHADISITLDLYSHVTPGMGAEAAAKIGAALYDQVG